MNCIFPVITVKVIKQNGGPCQREEQIIANYEWGYLENGALDFLDFGCFI